jgi:Trk K+ transport system NAD-binding subunit
MVQVGHANSIIITTPFDVMTIKTLLALKQTSFYAENNLNHAVCLIRDSKNLDISKELGGKNLEVMYTAELKSKIFARSTIYPGLSTIYKKIFSFEDEEIYFLQDDRFIGKTIETLALTVNKSSVMGIFKKDTPYINPDKHTVFEAGDELIVVATDKNYEFIEESLFDITPYFNDRPYVFSSRKILTIGFNKSTFYVAKDMEQYVGTDSTLTMLLPNESNQLKIASKFEPKTYVSFQSLVGETFSRKSLEKIDLASFDTIAVFANQDITHDSADAETLLTLLHLNNLTRTLNVKPSVVIEIEETKNVEALAYVDVDDFLVSNVLFSKIMAQISENRHTNRVIQELISDLGNEFHLKRANSYLKEGIFYQMVDIQKAVLLKNHLFMGYKKHGEQIILNPNKLHTEIFGPKDRFIVLAIE